MRILNRFRLDILEAALIVAAIVLIALMFVPFLLGQGIKDRYHAMLTEVADFTGKSVRIEDYRQGWFTSKATLELKDPEIPVTFVGHQRVFHGPLYLGMLTQGRSPVVAAVVKGELVPAVQDDTLFEALFQGRPPLIYEGVIRHNGNIEWRFNVPSFAGQYPGEVQNVELASSDITLNVEYIADTGHFVGKSTVPEFKFFAGQSGIQINGAQLTFDSRKGSEGLMVGDSTFSFAQMVTQGQNGEGFVLNGLASQGSVEEQGDGLDISQYVKVQEMLVGEETIKEIELSLKLRSLNQKALLGLRELQQQMERKTREGIPDEQVSAIVMGEIMRLLPDLLKQASIAVMPIKMHSDAGEFQGELNVSLEGLADADLMDPVSIVKATSLSANMSIDELMMRKLIEVPAKANGAANRKPDDNARDETLSLLREQHVLALEDGVYRSEVELKKGVLKLNGKMVNPLTLVQSLNQPQQ